MRLANTLVALLALIAPALSHLGHHDDAEYMISDEKREELLKKWEQEVFPIASFLNWIVLIFPSCRFRVSIASRT